MERNFGAFENKLLSELEEVAKKENIRWLDYVPEGGETRDTVRERARNFLMVTITY